MMKKKSLIFALLLFTGAAFAQNVQMHYDFERGHATSTVEMFKVDNWGNTFFFIDMDYNGTDGGVSLSYWELARELKFWDAPISAHLEYNGGALRSGVMDKIINDPSKIGGETVLENDDFRDGYEYYQINNAFLAGPSYTYLAKDFSYGLTFMALYKYITLTPTDKPHNFQLTAVWFANFLDGKVTFSGFADFWKEDHTVSNDGFTTDFQNSKYVFLAEPQLWYNLNKNFSLGGELELASDFGVEAGFFARPTLAAKWSF